MKQETRDALNRYVVSGTPTGDFLRAVLANDLMEAAIRADGENRRDLQEICCYVANNTPRPCRGSYTKVNAWIAMKEDQLKSKA